MRRVGYEPAGVVKEGAAEVQTLFDVCGDGGPLQDSAHLF